MSHFICLVTNETTGHICGCYEAPSNPSGNAAPIITELPAGYSLVSFDLSVDAFAAIDGEAIDTGIPPSAVILRGYEYAGDPAALRKK